MALGQRFRSGSWPPEAQIVEEVALSWGRAAVKAGPPLNVYRILQVLRVLFKQLVQMHSLSILLRARNRELRTLATPTAGGPPSCPGVGSREQRGPWIG